MDNPTKSIIDELLDVVKSWMPRKTKAPNVSRDFWMPDHSCRVCCECDSQFSTFNRRHHCRLCERVFCAKCTSKSIPASSDEPNTGQEDWKRIRVCNFCYKQWEDETMAASNWVEVRSLGLSPTHSSTSLVSSTSGTGKCSRTAASMAISTEAFQHVSNGGLIPDGNGKMGSITDKQDLAVYRNNADPLVDVDDQSNDIFGFCVNMSDDENDDYNFYQSDSETRDLSQTDGFYGFINYEDIDHPYVVVKENSEEDTCRRYLGSSPTRESLDSQELEGVNKPGKIPNDNIDGGEGEAPSSPSIVEGKMVEPVDFENDGLLWIPPGPKNVEDYKEAVMFDDDEDDATGEWRHLRPSTIFGDGESRTKEKSDEEHKKAMKNVIDGHFRALVSQLMQVENLPVGEEVDRESWLDIITSLSWEVATFLKSDTSKGGGMDPGIHYSTQDNSMNINCFHS